MPWYTLHSNDYLAPHQPWNISGLFFGAPKTLPVFDIYHRLVYGTCGGGRGPPPCAFSLCGFVLCTPLAFLSQGGRLREHSYLLGATVGGGLFPIHCRVQMSARLWQGHHSEHTREEGDERYCKGLPHFMSWAFVC